MIVIAGARGSVGRALLASLPDARAVRGVKPLHSLPAKSLVFLCWPERIVVSRLAELRALPLRYVLVSGSLDLGLATFHPLYGFSPGLRTSLTGVPVGISASSTQQSRALRVSRRELRALALSVHAAPFDLPRDRSLYHAAAVIAGAGVLTAWLNAVAMLRAAGLSSKKAENALLPIAQQALDRRVLTGPVVRGDERTLAAHERALRKARLSPALYRALIAQMRVLHKNRS